MEVIMAKNLTKAEKRKMRENTNEFVDIAHISKHYFKELKNWINDMMDPRHQSYITYTQPDLIFQLLLKNLCSVESMNQMEEKFNEEICIHNLKTISGNKNLIEIPHYDTVNNYLEKLSPECLDELRGKMIRKLIRSKTFDSARIAGGHWRVILDGTGLFHFRERHCEHCLKRVRTNEDGTKRIDYYHHVLEAKLVLHDKIIISLGTEFIENEHEDVEKQDCELNAAKRLLARIKKQYPRLKICVLGDALYAAESIMKICRTNEWTYILNNKGERQKSITEDYDYIKSANPDNYFDVKYKSEKGISYYVNHVEEVTGGKTEIFNVYEYEYTQDEKSHRFVWITNIDLKKNNLEEMVAAGRSRWKIENEGFNNQKNGLYRIEHLNSKHSTAMKNHYLLVQIADILMQLYLASKKLVEETKEAIKNTPSRLLEFFRKHAVTGEDVIYIHRHTTVHLE